MPAASHPDNAQRDCKHRAGIRQQSCTQTPTTGITAHATGWRGTRIYRSSLQCTVQASGTYRRQTQAKAMDTHTALLGGGGGGGTTPTCQASTSLPERDRRQPHMCQCQPKISNTKQCSCSRCSKGYFSRAIDTVHVTCTHPVTVVAHIQPTPRQQVTCMQGSHAKVQAHKHLTGDMVIPLASTHGEPPTE